MNAGAKLRHIAGQVIALFMEDSGLFKFGGILNGGFGVLKNKILHNRQSDYACAAAVQEDCKSRTEMQVFHSIFVKMAINSMFSPT